MRPLSCLVALLCLVSLAGASVRAEGPGACVGIAEDAARLACFDAAATDLGLLQRLLGDPAAIGKDYPYLGNVVALSAQLPGRWLVMSWESAAGFLAKGLSETACAKSGTEIAPSARDSYAFAATATNREGQPVVLYDLVWVGGSGFAQVRNLEQTLAHQGLDPAKQGFGPAMTVINGAVLRLTLLPISVDTVLALEPGGRYNFVMLRCPAAG